MVRVEEIKMPEHRLKKTRDAYQPNQVLTFKGVPIHTCSKAPTHPEVIGIAVQLIQELGTCPFCLEDIQFSKEP